MALNLFLPRRSIAVGRLRREHKLSGSYHINNHDGLVTIKSAPNVNLEDSCSMATQVLSDPSFDPTLPQLIDLRGVHNHMSYADEMQFRDFILTQYMPRVESSIAIVIDDELDSEILARLFHMSASMEKTELFDHYNQALKWLMRKEFANG